MSRATALLVGAPPRTIDNAKTVGDMRRILSLANDYAAALKGEPVGDDHIVEEDEVVSFAPKVRGGCY